MVLITTKKGTPGKAKWDLTGQVGTFTPSNSLNLRSFPTAASAEAWYNAYKVLTPSSPWNSALYQGNNDMQSQVFGGGEPSYEGDLSVRGQSWQNAVLRVAAVEIRQWSHAQHRVQQAGWPSKPHAEFSEATTGNLNMYFAHSDDRRGITGNDNVGISPITLLVTPLFFNMTPVDLDRRVSDTTRRDSPTPIRTRALIQTPEEVSAVHRRWQRRCGGSSRPIARACTAAALAGADIAHQTDVSTPRPTSQIETNQPLPGVATNLSGDNTYLNYNVNLVHHYAGGSNFDATTSIGIGRDQRYLYNPYSVGQELPPGIAQARRARCSTTTTRPWCRRTFDFYAQEQFLTLDQRLALSAGITAERATDNGFINTYYPYPKFSASFRVPQFAGFLDELKLRGAWGRSGTDPIFGVRYANVDNLTPQLDQGVTGLPTPSSSNDPGIEPETEHRDRDGIRRDDVVVAGAILVHDLPEADHGPAAAGRGGVQLGEHEPVVEWWTVHRPRDRVVAAVDADPDDEGTDMDLHVDLLPELQRHGRAPGAGVLTGDGVRPGVRAVLDPGRPVPHRVRQREQLVWQRLLSADGDVAPSYTMSFGNTFTLARFHLYGLLDWQRGGNIGNLTNAYFDPNGLFLLADSALEAKRNAVNNAGGPAYVESASFIKLREVTLSYALPDRWVTGLGWLRLSSARLQVSGRNLWSSFPYTGLDPEVSNFGTQNIGRGQDVTPYPPSRSVFFSLDLGF